MVKMVKIYWNEIIDWELILSVLTIIYYMWLLVHMLRSSKSVFQSAFFRIFIVTGFFDIQCIVAAEWLRADWRMGLGPDYELVTRIMGVFTGPQSFIHLFGSLLMTINRYTAACHPRVHNILWRPKWTYSLLTFGITSSFLVHFPLFMNSFVYEVIDGKWMIVGWAEPIPYIRIMSVVVVVTYEVVSVFLIMPTVYVVARMNSLRTSKFRKEMGLVIILAMDCVLGAFDCAYETSDLIGFDRAMNPVLFFIEENHEGYSSSKDERGVEQVEKFGTSVLTVSVGMQHMEAVISSSYQCFVRFCLFLFLNVSLNAYVIIFLSSDLQEEVLESFKVHRWRRTSVKSIKT